MYIYIYLYLAAMSTAWNVYLKKGKIPSSTHQVMKPIDYNRV